MTQHRLPLFLRSDLYSEYKLCKLLIVHTLERNTTSSVNADTLRPQKSQSATRLPSKKTHAELLSKSSRSAVCLPSLSPRGDHEDSPPLGSTLPSSAALSHVSGSKSDIELGSKGQQQQRSSGSLVSLSQQKFLQKPVNIPVDVPHIVLDDSSPGKTGGRNSSRSIVKDSMKMTAEDFVFIGTKSGMSALWKFLRGTMGERNWLFWLDSERVKYYSKPIDQQRYVM